MVLLEDCNKYDMKGSMSAAILFPITHLKCNDRGTFAVGCGSDVLVLGLLPVKGYLHERVGVGWRGGAETAREGEKERERDCSYITASLHLLCYIILEVREEEGCGDDRREWWTGRRMRFLT